jgi:dipeptidyl aminopeptidase/acylaminoacyl peptidase
LVSDKEIASSSPLVWSPDGSTILLGLRPKGWAVEARRAFLALTEAAVIVQDSRNDFLAWDRVRNIANQQITALVSVADGSVREILADVTPQGPSFSEDGSYITYSTAVRTKTSYTRRDGTDYELLMLDLNSGESASLMDPSEERTNVSWTEAHDAFAYGKDGSIFVMRVGEEEAVDVTEAHRITDTETKEPEFSFGRWSSSGSELLLTSERGWHVLDIESGDMRDLLVFEDEEQERPRRAIQAWSKDGRYVYFSYSARDRWQRGLKRLNVESGEAETLVLDGSLYSSWNVSDDGSTIVYTMTAGDSPNEIWVTGPDYSMPKQLTSMNTQLGDVALTHTELVEYLDVDGNTLYGILYYPINYEAGQVYPLVAEIYEQFFDNGFNENMNLITAQGWFGFRPSVRFEEGYPGEAWLKAVPNAINKLIERGLVDEGKVGVYGQSYGGYATNLLITQTDRFAAAANVSGKVNIISFLGDSPKITTRNYAAAEVGQDRIGATLWEQPHKYVEHSAVMFADRIKTPLLMLSGEGDWNVPATNQREMYYALRRLGKEVVWVHYTAGGHGAGRSSSAEDFVDHWQRMFEWFAEHFDDSGEGSS